MYDVYQQQNTMSPHYLRTLQKSKYLQINLKPVQVDSDTSIMRKERNLIIWLNVAPCGWLQRSGQNETCHYK